MADKEIIVNDINVAGCGYYDPKYYNGDCMIQGLGINDSILYCNCKDNPNCIYKQLQRKTLECTAKKYTIQELYSEIESLQSKLDHCREELQIKIIEYEDLKYEKDLYVTWYRAKKDDWADAFIKNVKINDRFREGIKRIYNLINKLETDCAYGDENCDDCDHEGDTICSFYIQKTIKQICDNLLT